MSKRPSTIDEASELRRQAETRLDGQKQSNQSAAAADMQNLIHELQVHQIELEMQNEELRRTRTELEASQTRYFDIFDLAPVGYLILSEKNMIVEANLTAASLLGLARSSLTNYSFPLFIQRADRGLYHQHWKKLIETSDLQACELRMKRRDGSPFWARLEMSAGLDAGGAQSQRVVLSDISERKHTQDVLYASEMHYRALVEGTPGIVYSFSNKRGGIFYSSHVMDILGYLPEQLYAQPLLWHKSIHPDDILRTNQAINETSADKPFHIEYRIRDAHGNWLWFDDRSLRYQVKEDEVITEGLALDITERKLLEDALRESELHLRLASEAADFGWYAYDFLHAAGVWSAGFKTLLGLHPDQDVPLDQDALFTGLHPEDRNGFLTGMLAANAPQGSGIFRHEYRIILPDGAVRWLQVRGQTTFAGDGAARQSIKAAGVVFDITNHKQAETALHASEQKYRILFDTMNEGVALNEIVLDEYGEMIDYRVLEVNQAFYSTADFVGPVVGSLATELYGMSLEVIKTFWHEHKDRKTVQLTEFTSPFNGRHFIISTSPIVNNRFVTSFFDITERKHAEELVMESEAQLAMAQQIGSTGSWGYNIETDTIWGSDEALRIYGLPPVGSEGFPIKKVEACIPENERVHQALVDLIKEEREYDLEFVINPADGSASKVISSRARLEKNSKGKSHKVIGFLQDITARKQAEELLRESEENYRRSELNLKEAQSVAHVGSWHWDLKTKEVTWSDEMYRIFGIDKFSYGGRLGDVIAKVIHPEDLHIVLPSNAQAISEKKPIEYRIILPDGSIRNIWAKAGDTIFDQEDKPIKMTGVAQDITERKRAEDALREAHWRLESIIEATQVGTWEWNVQTGETVFNEKWAQIIGYTLDELTPISIKTWERFAHPDEFKQSDALLDRHFTGELPNYYSEVRMKHKDGRWVWVLDRGRVMTRSSDGKPLMMFGTHQDISARKRAELDLQTAHDLLEHRVVERTAELRAANRDLEKAARMKDEFLAAMSHELRTPLTGILGLSEVMQMPGYGPLTEKQSTSLMHIHDSGQRLLEIINDILAFSMIGSGKFDLDLVSCSLEEICQSSLRQRLAQADTKHLQHNFSMSPSHIMVSADVRRLQQILSNMLSNAVKFTPQGGSFGIEVLGDASEKQVRITVWDTGIGIKEEDIPRLFQPFIQLDARLARQYNGTGLGLALVRRLTELHGGSVSVESVLGSGSRFTVTLPCISSA